MKRQFSEMSDVKPEPNSDVQQTMVMLIAQKVTMELLSSFTGGNATRFGRVAFADEEQQNVDAFLHQKLGKDSLTRRPGPGGRKLTYIESCKAIELANRAFGFNGWSCHIIECKEEYKEKKGDRWSIAYSSIVRIELKDGTSHEDVGFGSSDGQRDLGAALEQAKKASISDARKRALRLFGEYLGNSCYDREHIKDVNSNKPMAPLVAAPNVVLPRQQGQNNEAPRTSVENEEFGGQNVPARKLQPNQQPRPQQQPLPQQQSQQVQQPLEQMPTLQSAQPHQHNQQTQQHKHQLMQKQPRPPQQSFPQHQQAQQPLQQQLPTPESAQPHQQKRQSMQQQAQTHQQQQWKPPQVLRHLSTTNDKLSAQQPTPVHSRSATMLTTGSDSLSAARVPSPSTTATSSSTSRFRSQPQRWVSSNAPPLPRMMVSKYLPPIVKSEQSSTGQAQPEAQYNIEDLSLSQFDYDPNAGNDNPAKKMRS
ncbi:unnamed protein product [Peronospora belbahrii]|uniref:DNA repair and recombination protein RAD52 n=1 Tax=Peronospora belbahrii TaxID=622444 RepID=A0AAU9KRX5_9STRA|nr:unnamed protein product [Peronospora belbahrii]